MKHKSTLIKSVLLVCMLWSACCANAQQFTLADIPLSWKDFNVKPEFNRHPYDAKIYTLSPARYQYKQDRNSMELMIHTEVKVDTDKSWVKKKFWDNATKEQKEALLNHEKGHLIIALIYYKKFQQALAAHQFTRQQFKAQVDSISKSFDAQSDAMNVLYDEETNHMMIVEKQQEWMEKLLKQFNGLYADDKKIVMKGELKRII